MAAGEESANPSSDKWTRCLTWPTWSQLDGGRWNETWRSYKMSQCRIRPQYTLGRYSFSCLPHIHANDCTEEILNLVRVCVMRHPSRARDHGTAHHQCRKMNQCDTVQSRRKQSCDILFVAKEKDPSNSSLELRHRRHCLGYALVDLGISCRVQVIVAIPCSMMRVTIVGCSRLLGYPRSRFSLDVRILFCGHGRSQSSGQYG